MGCVKIFTNDCIPLAQIYNRSRSYLGIMLKDYLSIFSASSLKFL